MKSNSTAILIKIKLRHSLGRPSRSDFVQSVFVEESPMKEKSCQTCWGTIHYWASVSNPDTITLVFLPGLTADHRSFDKQIPYFENRYNVIIWDAPAHILFCPEAWYTLHIDAPDSVKWPMKKLSKRKRLRWTLKTVDLLGCGSPPPPLTVRKRTAVG